MTDGGGPARDKTRSCAACGALNGAEFDRCMRCGAALSVRAASVARASGSLDGRSLLGTKILGAMTMLVFAGQLMASLSHSKDPPILSMASAAIVPYGALELRPELVAAEPWRLLSAVFVHIGIVHVGMNLLGLTSLARVAEPAVGTARFIIAYVVTGVAGFATTVLTGLITGQGGFGTTAGASGAVFGVMGLILGFLLRRRDARWKQFAVQAVLFSVAFGFGINLMAGGIRVNNSAHIGGLAVGILFGLVHAGTRRMKSDLLINAGAVLALVACVGSIALAQLSPRGRSGMPDPFSLRTDPSPPGAPPPSPAPAGFRLEGREIAPHRRNV